MSASTIIKAVVATSLAIGALASPAAANTGSFADKALTALKGTWVSASKGRTIKFEIKDWNAIFEDEFEPNIKVTGAYRQDDLGAGYVLRYRDGIECRYNVKFITGSEGNEMVFNLVSGPKPSDAVGRFRCLEGALKRTR